MIVYVESNFVLELAYQQEQHQSCDDILAMAEAGRIGLVLPAFAISEPFDSFSRRVRSRKQLLDNFQQQVVELARSRPYTDATPKSSAIAAMFAQSIDAEKARLDAAILRILRVAETIPTTHAVMESAIESHQAGQFKEPQDAVIYAAVVAHLQAHAERGPSCFMNRNSRDFQDPDIIAQLKQYDCVLIPSFSDGLAFVRTRDGQGAGGPSTG